MQTKTAQELAQILIDAGFTANEPIIPCSSEDIEQMQNSLQLQLPRTYVDFLQVMGRQAGDFLLDATWTYPLQPAREDAESMLASDSQRKGNLAFKLEKSMFVFLANDSFFLFFDLIPPADDPPVFIYEEGALLPRRFFESFSEWLTVCVTSDAEKNKEHLDWQAKQAAINP